MDTVIYYVQYYANVLIALCGFDGSAGNDTVGWVAVVIALGLVIAAFYLSITYAIWPGESDTSHIKYRILEEGEPPHAH